MSEQIGDALLTLRTDDRGLDAGIDRAKAKSEGLGRTLDATSGSASRMGAAIEGAGDSATRAVPKTERYNTSLEQLGKASNAQRAGLQQLQFQLGDIATMYASGARPSQIFATQIGQVTQAVQLMSGGTSKFAAFLGGPWGIALTTGTVLLTPLISSLLDTEDAADKAGDANETLADKLDLTKHSTEEVIEALREYNAEQEKANEVTIEGAKAAVEAAAAKLKEAAAIREKLRALLEMEEARYQGMLGPGADGAGAEAGPAGAPTTLSLVKQERIKQSIAKQDEDIRELHDQSRQAIANAQQELARIDTDQTYAIQTRYQLLRNNARDTITDVRKLREELGKLNRAEEDELNRARDSERRSRRTERPDAGPDTRSNQQVWQDFAAALAEEGIKRAAGRTGFRTAQDQNSLFQQGLTPLDGFNRRSRHQSWQAFDPTRASHDDAAARRAADRAGLTGFKIVTESGGRKHYEWKGSRRGGSGEDGVEDLDRALEEQRRAAEEEARRVERYTRDLAGLQDAALGLQQQLTGTAEERHAIERQALDIAIAEQRRRILIDQDYTAAEKKSLLAALEKKAALESELLKIRQKEELARQALEIAQAMRSNEIDLLRLEADLAETREERHAIEKRILDLAYEQEQADLESVLASTQATEAQKEIARQRLRMLERLKAGDTEAMNREFADPVERYIRDIELVGKNIDDEVGKVAVNGLQELNNQLADAVMGTKSLGDAFKAVASQIIAELIRIAIMQTVIKPLAELLGSSDGLGGIFGGAFGGGGGLVSGGRGGLFGLGSLGGIFGGGGGGGGGIAGAAGAGIGKLFSGFFAKGGLIPNGTFGIVGEAGPEPVIGTSQGAVVLPNASLRGGLGGVSLSMPIAIDATGADAAGLERVRASIDRLREELPQRIVGTVQEAGERGILAPGAWR